MAGQEAVSKRPRLTGDQVERMIHMRRQGQSINDIAEDIGCHRQTVRLRLKEKRGAILADEVRRQMLVDEMLRHIDDLSQFADSLLRYLRVPTSPKVEGDAEAALTPLWGRAPQNIRRKKRLFESLQEHMGERGGWVAFKVWEETWNACKRALEEIQKEGYDVVRNLINEKAGLREEVRSQSSQRGDVTGGIADNVLWVVWLAGTGDRTVEGIKFEVEGNSIVVAAGIKTHYAFNEGLGGVTLGQDMLEVCECSFETLYQSFSGRGISEMIEKMKGAIENIGDGFDRKVLRSQILRTRCSQCPA